MVYKKLFVHFVFINAFIIVFGCKQIDIERELKITQTEVSDISYENALAKSSIVDYGEEESIIGHCWSESKVPTIEDYSTSFSSHDSLDYFNSNIKNLKPNTTYYLRAYSIFLNEVLYDEEISFTTLNYSPSQVSTLEAIQTSSTSVEVKGVITDFGDGYNGILQYGHCWSKNNIPTIYDMITEYGVVDSLVTFTSTVKNLQTGVKYLYRAYSINKLGISYGNIVALKTEATIPIVSVSIIDSLLTPFSVTVETTVIDDGNGTITEIGYRLGPCPLIPTIDYIGGTQYDANRKSFRAKYTVNPNTCYNIKGFARNYTGIGLSKNLSFTTPEE